ncbi:MAG: adenylosuccinate synthase [Candidatus Micrarchaeota archaeon]
MPVLAVIGAQFGDEGKGKIVDALAQSHDLVVRFNGGANAGHTIKVKDKEFKLHLVPSGVVHKRKRNIIASGVAFDPVVFVKEVEGLRAAGFEITPENLGVDLRAQVVMPWHRLLDAAKEDAAASGAIGTTMRGIGPAYEDKAARTGIRVCDLIDPHAMQAKVTARYMPKRTLLENYYAQKLPPEFNEQSILVEYGVLGQKIAPFACDASLETSAAIKKGKRVLLEGAQGTLLDANYGTYPFVTSSNCTAPAAAVSAGIPAASIGEVHGVVKAYTTRVGNGPLPTELLGSLGERLRGSGREFGTTTGRPRRVGWLDLPMIRYSARINGFTAIHITKLDVLSGFSEIQAAVAYSLDGAQTREFPVISLDRARPVYRKFAGFGEVTQKQWRAIAQEGKKKGLAALPDNARKYIEFVERESGVAAASVSVGPERSEIIYLK